jgi:hypothetical protein
MPVKLVFEPRQVVTWEQFSVSYPSRSIAVDGFCYGPPRYREDRTVLNINHHEGCDRIATDASCLQALHRVRMGLYKAFSKDGKPDATVYCNDCDQDVALATYVLTHPEHAARHKLMTLIRMENLMDMSAGLYPISKRSRVMRQLAWISRPYTEARVAGRLKDLTPEGMSDIVGKIHCRLDATLKSKVKEVDLDTRFEVLDEFPEWVFVRELGLEARIGMAERGIEAFVSLVEESDGAWRYTIGRLSNTIPFPIIRLYDDLNDAEGVPDDETDRWGGSDTIGGSPRSRMSRLPPKRIAQVVNRRLKLRRRAKEIYGRV